MKYTTQGNCPFCDSERGIITSWGMSQQGWNELKKKHDAGHPENNESDIQLIKPKTKKVKKYKYSREQIIDIYKLKNKKWAKPFIRDLLAKEENNKDTWQCSYCKTWNEWKYDTCGLCGTSYEQLFGKSFNKPLATQPQPKDYIEETTKYSKKDFDYLSKSLKLSKQEDKHNFPTEKDVKDLANEINNKENYEQEDNKECKHLYKATYDENRKYCITCGKILSSGEGDNIEEIEETSPDEFKDFRFKFINGKINQLIRNQNLIIKQLKQK